MNNQQKFHLAPPSKRINPCRQVLANFPLLPRGESATCHPPALATYRLSQPHAICLPQWHATHLSLPAYAACYIPTSARLCRMLYACSSGMQPSCVCWFPLDCLSHISLACLGHMHMPLAGPRHVICLSLLHAHLSRPYATYLPLPHITCLSLPHAHASCLPPLHVACWSLLHVTGRPLLHARLSQPYATCLSQLYGICLRFISSYSPIYYSLPKPEQLPTCHLVAA